MIAIILLAILGVLWMLADIFPIKKFLFPLTILGYLATALAFFLPTSIFTPMLVFNPLTVLFCLVILGFSFIGIWVLHLHARAQSKWAVNPMALVIFSTVGGIIATAYYHFITLFLGIEILSIPIYVLASSRKDSEASQEAGLKYFLLGAFASALLLFGMALIYAGTGKLYLSPSIGFAALAEGAPSLVILSGFFLMVAGLGFKVGLVPFQAWVPDVYQGSPTVYTGLMSTMVKTVAFAAFLKLLILFSPLYPIWGLPLGIIAILSMALGNALALHQLSLKRLFAYSSIAHAGYMLMSLLPLSNSSFGSLLYYLVAYGVASAGVFYVILILESQESEHYTALHGLFKRNFLLALLFLVSVLSLAGIPPFPGFFAKYLVLVHALSQAQYGLVLMALVNFLVGIYYYFRLIFGMLDHQDHKAMFSLTKGQTFLAIVLLLLNLCLGIFLG